MAGPLILKNGDKVWVVLFTCAVYRALHLELVKSLSTAAFLYSLRRFISRRGRPRIIYSDNGTNFHGSNNFFAKLNWEEIENFSGIKRIKWIFNPPSASWWGGWWERLVRIVKELLRRTLGKASLYYVELYTVLCDVESVINERPLTYVSGADEWEVLSPSRFLRPLQNVSEGSGFSVEVADLDLVDTKFLLGRFKHLQKTRAALRGRFEREYLAELVNVGQKRSSVVKVGDIVLVGSDNTKRIGWPMGKILEVCEGKDGVKRVAKVKTKSGEVTRPFQRLYPLELPATIDLNVEPKISSQLEEAASSSQRQHNISRYGRVRKIPNRFGDS